MLVERSVAGMVSRDLGVRSSSRPGTWERNKRAEARLFDNNLK